MARTSPKSPSSPLAAPPEKNHQPAAGEGRLHDVGDPFLQRLPVHAGGAVGLGGGGLLQVSGRRLDLDDVGAGECGHVRGVGHHVERGLALLRERAAARIGPDDHSKPVRLRLRRQLADLLDHLVLMIGGGIDGETDRRTAEPERVADRPRHRLIHGRAEGVGVVDLEDGRDRAGKAVGTRLDHAERARKRVQTGVDGEPPVIVRVVGRRVLARSCGPARARSPDRPAG